MKYRKGLLNHCFSIQVQWWLFTIKWSITAHQTHQTNHATFTHFMSWNKKTQNGAKKIGENRHTYLNLGQYSEFSTTYQNCTSSNHSLTYVFVTVYANENKVYETLHLFSNIYISVLFHLGYNQQKPCHLRRCILNDALQILIYLFR